MAAGVPKPNFTGRWEVNLSRSKLLGPIPKLINIEIQHREPQLVQQIKSTDQSGAQEQLTFTHQIGSEVTNLLGSLPVRTFARWEENELGN